MNTPVLTWSSMEELGPNDPFLNKNKFADVLILIDLSEDVMY